MISIGQVGESEKDRRNIHPLLFFVHSYRLDSVRVVAVSAIHLLEWLMHVRYSVLRAPFEQQLNDQLTMPFPVYLTVFVIVVMRPPIHHNLLKVMQIIKYEKN